ncbi:hypothetical protein MHU86_15423 [Fragilaria crotonensis]|nr:hypothetical protein MHU86_15423 [Fragilaria crotonensis]
MTNKNKGKRKASENSSAEHVAFRQSNLALNPPSIYFDRPKKSTEKSDDEEAWVKWRIELEEVIRDYPLESGEQKASMALALLKGSARDKFQQTWRRLDTENVAGPARQRKTPNEIFQLVMTEVGKSYFPILHAYQKQVVYMQHYLRLGSHTVRNFATRLRELNNYLPYFPREEGKAEPSKLSDDDLIQILNQAKPEEWQAVILGANIELYKFDFQGTVDYFEKLELRQALEAKRRKVDKTDNPEGEKGNWIGKQKPGKKNVGSTDRNVLMTQEQLNAILERLPRNPKSGKRKVRDFTPENSDAEIVEMFSPKTTISTVETKEDSDESSIYFGLFSSEILPSKDGHGSKRQKQKHKTTEVVGEVMGTGKPGIVRILLDTGASATIILKDAIRGLTGPVFKTSHTRWHTMGGQFVTKLQRKLNSNYPSLVRQR